MTTRAHVRVGHIVIVHVVKFAARTTEARVALTLAAVPCLPLPQTPRSKLIYASRIDAVSVPATVYMMNFARRCIFLFTMISRV